MSHYSPIDRLRYNLDDRSVLRMEHIDRYETNTRGEFVWEDDKNYYRRDNFASNLDVSSKGFGVISCQSIGGNLNDRKVSRNLDDSYFELVKARGGYGMKTEKREGSTPELDFSVKSRSLVAEAIVASSTHNSKPRTYHRRISSFSASLPIDNKSEENRSSPSMEPLSDCFYGSTLDPTIENQADPSNKEEIQVEAYGRNMTNLNAKRIVYLKRKFNQLVATSNSCDLSISTDGYYKRRKNQFVGTKLKSHINKISVMAKDTVNSHRQGRPYKVLCNNKFNKKQSHKDDKSPSSASIRPRLGAKRAYTKRLIIGNDEYVQVGNGNKLIRDQKKRTRMLANKKFIWSLQNAGQEGLARNQYCQFYTRFGKCNKDDGNCPYIHDSSEITVCTKFLNGLCPISDCKLTHKVITERMPDCSYFLQGLCINGNCPYRHVNVNPKASICEGFLRGYCVHGIECRKKHSYICPTFEATGTCTQGTKCKLHHPNKQSKGKENIYGNQRNSGGRYFGSMPNVVSQPEMMVALGQCQQCDNGPEGEVADYVTTDVKTAENISRACEQASLSDSDPMDLQMDNLDQLIKPVRIMKKDFMTSLQA
ncbi:putative zinc finger CCCH domain protein [Senna tora]|uniref:Putative zinc finger CCCH domain protein n=1 Tax=Senna tora TaxID=362788 RepID=A0A834T7Q1_9FABA|nr:putative zinc finger CCCH domain protein [Senna tora]